MIPIPLIKIGRHTSGTRISQYSLPIIILSISSILIIILFCILSMSIT